MGQLLNQHSPTETILFQGPVATLKISTSHKPSKQLATIHQWTNCFDIFMSIYLLKFTDRVQQILKYANMIRSLSAKVGFEAAHYYDEEFRKLKAAHGLEWSVIHRELWRSATSLQYRAAPTKPRDKVPFRRDSQQEFLKGFCWQYRARKSRTTLQNKVRLKVLPEQLTLFVNTSVTLKKCIVQLFSIIPP